ncbi:unnamed protein product, partial [Didymodactylos carnosus]
ISISKSTFQELRPRFVLYKSTLAHRICICVHHENIHLLINALSKHVTGLKAGDLSAFTSMLICDVDDEKCMSSKCIICKNYFKDHITEKVIDKNVQIGWFQWSNESGRARKEEFEVDDCVKVLKGKIKSYLWHVFIKHEQSNYFEYIKQNAGDKTVVIQVDYAENFTMDEQNQIQSAHWSKKQLSIFTAYAWCSGSGGDVGFSFGLVSNNTTHDKFSVATCLDVIVNEIKSYVPDVNEIIFFSDGAASQFKNRFLLRYLTYMMDDNAVDISWNFFASSHGKGVVDGIGGTLKRLVWSEMMAGKRCTSASDFVQICNEKTKTIIVGQITNAQIDVTIAKLSYMFDQTCSVPVIRKLHSIKVLHKNIIECSSYTNCTQTFVFAFK